MCLRLSHLILLAGIDFLYTSLFICCTLSLTSVIFSTIWEYYDDDDKDDYDASDFTHWNEGSERETRNAASKSNM